MKKLFSIFSCQGNINQNYTEIPSHLSHQEKNAGEDEQRKEPLYISGGDVNQHNHHGKQYVDYTQRNLSCYIPETPVHLGLWQHC